jgi:oligoribonuclease
MNSDFTNGPLVWLDLEFTDLDFKRSAIVEIATVITDSRLNIKAVGPDLVIHQPEEVIKNMVRWNQEHFAESGLLEEIRQSKISLRRAYDETLKFVKSQCAFKTGVLCGSSVYIDREFLGEFMPVLYDYLHFRIIDTNTIKELMHRWYPRKPDYPKAEAHRAGKDIIESINELKYYQSEIFK